MNFNDPKGAEKLQITGGSFLFLDWFISVILNHHTRH